MSLLLTPNTAIESSFDSSTVDLSFGDPPPLFSSEMNPGVFADSDVLEGNTHSDVLEGNTESDVLEGNTTDSKEWSDTTDSKEWSDTTDSKEWSDTTDSKEWSDATLRAYVMLDLTSMVLYEDYTLSLLLQNYTGDVTVRTSRHVRLHSHPHA